MDSSHSYSIQSNHSDPRIEFAVERLKQADIDPGAAGISLQIDADCVARLSRKPSRSESFIIHKQADTPLSITGTDASGVLYGVLEAISRWGHQAVPDTVSLYDAPALDLRGPVMSLFSQESYDQPVTPQNLPWFYDREFWLTYLDSLIDQRYNAAYLWIKHPFPYFLRLPHFPEAQELPDEVLDQNIDMLEWITAEAHRRGVQLFFVIYNIYVSHAFAKVHDIPVANSESTPLLAAYTRECVREFVSHYPSVSLIVCAGEALSVDKEEWIRDVIIPGIKDSGKNPPLVIRKWQITAQRLQEVVLPHYDRIYTESKYNGEVLSSSDYIEPANTVLARTCGKHIVNIHIVANLNPFRWGSPEFIQGVVKTCIRSGAKGIHVYPLEFWSYPLTSDRIEPRLRITERDWIWNEVWGRYAWNPDRDPKEERAYWSTRLAEHFGTDAGEILLDLFQTHGQIMPRVTSSFGLGGGNDEAHALGGTLDQMMHRSDRWFSAIKGMTIREYVTCMVSDGIPQGETPLQAAEAIEEIGRTALLLLEHVRNTITNNIVEFSRWSRDIEATVLIGRHYAEKARAAVHILTFLKTKDMPELRQGSECLRASVNLYRKIVAHTEKDYIDATSHHWFRYKPLPVELGYLHWKDILPEYERELVAVEAAVRDLDDPATEAVVCDALMMRPHVSREELLYDSGTLYKGSRSRGAWLFFETAIPEEYAAYNGSAPLHYEIRALIDGRWKRLWQYSQTDYRWQPHLVSVSTLTGKSIRLRFIVHRTPDAEAHGGVFSAPRIIGDPLPTLLSPFSMPESTIHDLMQMADMGEAKGGGVRGDELLNSSMALPDTVVCHMDARHVLAVQLPWQKDMRDASGCIEFDIYLPLATTVKSGWLTAHAGAIRQDDSWQLENTGSGRLEGWAINRVRQTRQLQSVDVEATLKLDLTKDSEFALSWGNAEPDAANSRKPVYMIRVRQTDAGLEWWFIYDGAERYGYEYGIRGRMEGIPVAAKGTYRVKLSVCPGSGCRAWVAPEGKPFPDEPTGWTPEGIFAEGQVVLALNGPGATTISDLKIQQVAAPTISQPILAETKDPAKRVMLTDWLQRTIETTVVDVGCHARSAEEWDDEKPIRRQRLLECLGLEDMPERTPLEVQHLGEVVLPDCRVEKLIFHPRPGIPVPALLYKPLEYKGKLPAVLSVVGHWGQGKLADGEIARGISLARHGYAVLAYDPIGQGERFAWTPKDRHNHLEMHLVGMAQEGWMAWESIRALDYLCSRQDINPRRIGMTGASGGGTNTLLTSLVDNRVRAAGICVYFCNWAGMTNFLRDSHWFYDVCNQTPRLMTLGDQSDLLGIRAPELPVLILNSQIDPSFPIREARAGFQHLQKIYSLYNAEDRVRMAEIDLGHGYWKPFREEAAAWFDRWLLGKTDAIINEEEPIDIRGLRERLRVLPAEAIPESASYVNRTIYQFAEEILTPVEAGKDLIDTIRSSIVLPPPARAKIHSVRMQTERKALVETLRFDSEPGAGITASIAHPPGQSAGIVVWLDEWDRANALASKECQAALSAGFTICSAELRGQGETLQQSTGFPTVCEWLGKPVLGQWVFDIDRLLQALRQDDVLRRQKVILAGNGAMGVPALLAGLLLRGIDGIASINSILSFRSLLLDRWDAVANFVWDLPRSSAFPPAIYLFDVLRQWDLPTVIAELAPKPLLITQPRAGDRQLLSASEKAFYLDLVKERYRDARSASKLALDKHFGEWLKKEFAEK